MLLYLTNDLSILKDGEPNRMIFRYVGQKHKPLVARATWRDHRGENQSFDAEIVVPSIERLTTCGKTISSSNFDFLQKCEYPALHPSMVGRPIARFLLRGPYRRRVK